MGASVGETFYNVEVSPAEMWRAVGKALEGYRHDRKWKPIDVERAGGPSYKTVQAIEAGEIKNVESLDKCAQALDVSIVDILHAILASKVTPLSPEAAHVVRAFEETTVDGRQAFLMMANALPRAPQPPAAGSATPPTPRPPRPGPRAVKPRSVR